MAYIYEFAFLCKTKHDALKIAWYLSDQFNGNWKATFTGLPCNIYVLQHHKINAEEEVHDQHWVGIMPRKNNHESYAKWPSGSIPDENKEEAKAFERAIYNEIDKFTDRLSFIYACAGVEVCGFRDRDEILELVEKEVPLKGAIIDQEMWADANYPPNWEYTMNTSYLKYNYCKSEY